MRNSGVDWVLEPPYARLFYEFLLVVCAMTLVRAARLVSALFSLGRQRLSIVEVFAQPVDPDRLARAALANAISCDGSAPHAVDAAGVHSTLVIAHARFEYLWSVADARVHATKGLLRLTLLVSLTMTVFTAYPEYYDAFNNRNVSGSIALFNAGELLLARLAIGLGVCVALCATCLFFEGKLIRRRSYWRLFYKTALNALNGGSIARGTTKPTHD